MCCLTCLPVADLIQANVMPQPADGQEAEPEGETVEEGGASMSVGPAADVKVRQGALHMQGWHASIRCQVKDC